MPPPATARDRAVESPERWGRGDVICRQAGAAMLPVITEAVRSLPRSIEYRDRICLSTAGAPSGHSSRRPSMK